MTREQVVDALNATGLFSCPVEDLSEVQLLQALAVLEYERARRHSLN